MSLFALLDGTGESDEHEVTIFNRGTGNLTTDRVNPTIDSHLGRTEVLVSTLVMPNDTNAKLVVRFHAFRRGLHSETHHLLSSDPGTFEATGHNNAINVTFRAKIPTPPDPPRPPNPP